MHIFIGNEQHKDFAKKRENTYHIIKRNKLLILWKKIEVIESNKKQKVTMPKKRQIFFVTFIPNVK